MAALRNAACPFAPSSCARYMASLVSCTTRHHCRLVQHGITVVLCIGHEHALPSKGQGSTGGDGSYRDEDEGGNLWRGAIVVEEDNQEVANGRRVGEKIGWVDQMKVP